ncbi:MAG: hypothetical protein WC787_02340 [Patescibacteria group bacterium]|jgi:hypothetical protein
MAKPLGPFEKAARKRDRLLAQGKIKEAHAAFDGQIFSLFVQGCVSQYSGDLPTPPRQRRSSKKP